MKGVAMARAIWTGSLSFGLVNVPVALFAATEERAIRFHQFQAGTTDRVRNKRVNERTGDDVAYEDIVKGFDLGGGDYVIVTPDEIASVAPGRSKTIDVSAFVNLAEIDPIYFDRPYYMAPSGKGGERAYALLREAMMSANKVALATFVLRDKQYLVAVRPRQDTLVLETLLYADEVRDPLAEIPTLPVEGQFEQRELEMATMLIDSMTTDWQPETYHDSYRERLEALIEQKRSGEVVSVEPQAPQAAPVVDLLSALEASVRAARGTGTADGARDKPGQQPSATPRRNGRAAASAGRTAPSDELGTMGKAELLRRAAELGVAGRSKMSRDDLEAAVRAASGTRRRKAS
jgi:DNA end-binding protein Ku